MIIAGVDEAGRGPVIGPMVFSVVAIDEKQQNKLVSLGVTDSKMIAPQEREELFGEIQKLAQDYKILSLSAAEITEWMKTASLNDIEAIKTAEIINSLDCEPDVCYVDCPDTNEARYSNSISNLCKKKTRIVAEHKADMTYRVAGAASILAKVTRDRAIKELCREYGELGSGYPGDPLTKKWLDECWTRDKSFPDIVRKRWSTVSRRAQLQLTGF
jgi:ribonuclease HII